MDSHNKSQKNSESNDSQILDSAIHEKNTFHSEWHEIKPRNRPDKIPLSFAQQRMWFLNQYDSNSTTYIIPTGFRIKGELNIDIFNQAFSEIINRHESLRTTFSSINGQPNHIINSIVDTSIPVFDLQHINFTEREKEAYRFIEKELLHPIDITREVLSPFMIILDTNDFIFLLNIHHIATDGWSQDIIFSELGQVYSQLCKGNSADLPELKIQYSDFAFWQLEQFQSGAYDGQISYWSVKLKSPSLLDLPIDFPRPRYQTYLGADNKFQISDSLSSAIKRFSRNERVSIYMFFLAVYKVFLMRVTNQFDICVGSPIAGRNRVEIEKLVGLFINTLVIRTDLGDNPTFRGLLSRVRDASLDAFEYQDLPFEKIVADLNPIRDLSRSPIFQTMLAFQNYPEISLKIDDLQIEKMRFGPRIAQFDLTFTILESKDGYDCSFTYNKELFKKSTIERMVSSLLTLLNEIIKNPSLRVFNYPIISAFEKQQLIVNWNNTNKQRPADLFFHNLFDEQAKKSPENAAIIFKNQKVTYRELKDRTNQLANYLVELNSGLETRVGLLTEDSIEMVVGLIAVLKAGCSFVPLDPDLPEHRLKYIMENSEVSMVLAQESLLENLSHEDLRVICLDRDYDQISKHSVENPEVEIQTKNLAYIIYTSGSTGTPKGVAIQHDSLNNYLQWVKMDLFNNSNSLMPALTKISFDASLKQLLAPLLLGGSVCIVPGNVRSDPELIVNLMREQEQVAINCVPSVWSGILDYLETQEHKSLTKDIKFLYLGADIFGRELIDRTYAIFPEITIWNLYGPTETTVNASSAKLKREDIISIGKPITNTQIYILDSQLQPVPIGVRGDLYIGGSGLARGYHMQPAATAENFIPNPFSDNPGARLYKTGDLAKYTEDGNVVYLGRSDNQVKIRGIRIEIGEIETYLSMHKGIKESVVITIGNNYLNKNLVAYIVLSGSMRYSVNNIRSYLKELLPDYMIPTRYVFLDTIPLTPSGKIDHLSLPKPEKIRPSLDTRFEAPSTAIETLLSNVWANIIGIDKVGVTDNFFELGGHSLLATQVVSRIRNHFSVPISLRTLFEKPTVREICEYIRENETRYGQSEKTAQAINNSSDVISE